jgi:hypothetical protein
MHGLPGLLKPLKERHPVFAYLFLQWADMAGGIWQAAAPPRGIGLLGENASVAGDIHRPSSAVDL